MLFVRNANVEGYYRSHFEDERFLAISAHAFDILNEQLKKEVIDVFDTVRCVKYQQKI